MSNDKRLSKVDIRLNIYRQTLNDGNRQTFVSIVKLLNFKALSQFINLVFGGYKWYTL